MILFQKVFWKAVKTFSFIEYGEILNVLYVLGSIRLEISFMTIFLAKEIIDISREFV